ncbi:MAG: MerR family transcriptional regulator [Devosia sp. 67-54]|mgnify:CR=1 FL=1|uniref:MerR family transcriptional regulator n=1 Tax=unclassified Devosia TaxID=196773 RepID=UPI000964D255|nr:MULTISPECIES: MerR family transcriptional regulator [unclassified Devosia]MBN9306394.1 MerR family transcriptional regulator [Devosia sp.]OJX18450.1 MAG: MerR family transcriptional regulator [Devosia sp. 67-54]
MDKSPEAFRTISEAADELDLPQHVLRFWETRFSTIKPLKRGGGRRYYRPEDVLLLKGIRHLLYDQGFTIKGVQKILKDQGVRHVAAIGNGGPVEALPPPVAPDPVEPDDLPSAIDEAPMPPMLAGAGPALDAADRERLNAVLRDLLECKRLLERARE